MGFAALFSLVYIPPLYMRFDYRLERQTGIPVLEIGISSIDIWFTSGN